MKILSAAIWMFCLTLNPSQLFSQSQRPWQVFMVGGVFSPIDDEVQNIYGDGLVGQVSLGIPLERYGRLRFSGNVYNRDGDPFYQSPDFDAGDTGELNVASLSLSLETSILTRNNSPRVFVGAGIDYVFAREKITGQPNGDANGVGAHLLIAPEILLSNRISLVAEARYHFLEMTFKSDRNRYRFDLSGTNLLLGLVYQL